MPRLRIAIAGAGTAGLAAALHLARDGHDVRIFERFEAPRPLGAGLMLQPTGLAALACLDLDEPAIGLGRIMRGIVGRTARGRTIFETRYDVLGPNCFGLAIHRAALFHVLNDAVLRAGVPIACSVDLVASAMVGNQRLLIDRAGRQHGPFDLVIDASGTRSQLRSGVTRPRYERPYPYGAVWGVAPEPPGWSDTDRLTQRYVAAHTMVGVLPIGRNPGDDRPLVAFFWSLPVRAYDAWRATPMSAWREQVAGVWPEIAGLIAQFRTHDDMTLATYSDILVDPPIADRIALIGDAARSSSPQLGQGANIALIDALVLAQSLREAGSVADALSRYARARRSHAVFYARASRLLTPFFQSDSRLAAFGRDMLFRPAACIPYVDREMVRTLAGMKSGLFSHLDPGNWHPRYKL